MRLRTLAIAILALGLVAVAGREVTVSDATFSAQTANPGNTFTASTSFPGIRVESGSYTGNGADNRNITGVGFQPDAVIVKASTNQISVMRTSTMAGDATKPLSGGTGLQTNRIQALQSDGFQVGTDAQVNSGGGSPPTYYWVAFKSFPGDMALGSYTGNNTSQSITGLGFSPEYVMILGATNERAVQRMPAMARTYEFEGDNGSTTGITSLDANGFSVGSDDEVNNNAVTYHYVAFNEDVDEIDTSSYTGNGAASRNITGVGFQPDYVIVRAFNTGGTQREGVQKATAVPDPGSGLFTATAGITNGITDLQSDGFSLGNDANVNNNTTPYAYVAFKDKP
jgi:hypothetical protein